MKRQLVSEKWNEFSRVVLPECSPVQRRSMRLAFYAGADALLTAALQNLSHTNETTDEDIQMMDNIYLELIAHKKEENS